MENSIFEKLNPTSLTAKACLLSGASRGDKYSSVVLDRLNKLENDSGDIQLSGDVPMEKLYRVSSAYGACIWTKSIIADRLFNSYRMTVFMDIGCGYSRRGLAFAERKSVIYYGIDLPPVIEKMKQITVQERYECGNRLNYCAVDATDLTALRSVIKGKYPLFIVTEGLMMYLTEPEMLMVVKNISALLAEFGGVWVTGDPEDRTVSHSIMKQLFSHNDSDAANLINSVFSQEWRKLIFDNSFMTLKDDEQKMFLEEYGLKRLKVSLNGYLDDIDIPENVKRAYKSSHFLALTPLHSTSAKSTPAMPEDMHIGIEKSGGDYIFRINGRLDTITAPKLVETFNACSEDRTLGSVTLDMAGCPYISSAGIRAVLILFKKMQKDKKGFSLMNICPEVYDILNMVDLTSFV